MATNAAEEQDSHLNQNAGHSKTTINNNLQPSFNHRQRSHSTNLPNTTQQYLTSRGSAVAPNSSASSSFANSFLNGLRKMHLLHRSTQDNSRIRQPLMADTQIAALSPASCNQTNASATKTSSDSLGMAKNSCAARLVATKCLIDMRAEDIVLEQPEEEEENVEELTDKYPAKEAQ